MQGTINKQTIDDIAAAIRSVNGSSVTYTPSEMEAAILALEDIILGGNGTVDTQLIDRSVTSIEDTNATKVATRALNCCDLLTSASFAAATSIGEKAFLQCAALQTLDIPQCTEIMLGAFWNCTALTTVNSPSLQIVGEQAFLTCTSLTTINVENVIKINPSGFESCKALEHLDFHIVQTISRASFNGCSKLKELIIRSESVCTLSSTSAFSSTPIKSGTGYIYVPSVLINTYKTATNWSTFQAQFRAIEDYPDICG